MDIYQPCRHGKEVFFCDKPSCKKKAKRLSKKISRHIEKIVKKERRQRAAKMGWLKRKGMCLFALEDYGSNNEFCGNLATDGVFCPIHAFLICSAPNCKNSATRELRCGHEVCESHSVLCHCVDLSD